MCPRPLLLALLLISARATLAALTEPPPIAELCLYRDGALASPGDAFNSGEIVSFELMVPRDGWVTLTWLDPEGALHALHDGPELARAGQPLMLPPLGDPRAVALTEPAGPETFLVVWSDATVSNPVWNSNDGPPPVVAASRPGAAPRRAPVSKGAARVSLGTATPQGPECLNYTPPDGPLWSIRVTLDHR